MFTISFKEQGKPYTEQTVATMHHARELAYRFMLADSVRLTEAGYRRTGDLSSRRGGDLWDAWEHPQKGTHKSVAVIHD